MTRTHEGFSDRYARAREGRSNWGPSEIPAVAALQGWSTRSSEAAAFALVQGRACAADWRPEALLWYFGRVEADVLKIQTGAVVAVLLDAARSGWTLEPESLAAAVLDAMHRVRHRRCTPAEVRARELGKRKEAFLALRQSAEAALLRAIRSGLRNYLVACGYRELCAPKNQQADDHGPNQRAA